MVVTNKTLLCSHVCLLVFLSVSETHSGPCWLQTGFRLCLLADLLSVIVGHLRRFLGRAKSLTLLRVAGTTC